VGDVPRRDFAALMEALPVTLLPAELIRRLLELRRRLGLTQQEVYDATGIHVARLEAHGANLTVLTLATLCRHYGSSLAELCAGL